MMNLLNCTKIVPDYDVMPEADWASGTQSGFFDFRYLKSIIDPFAECALSLSLAFVKENTPEESAHKHAANEKTSDDQGDDSKSEASGCVATALTVGSKLAEKPLQTLAALGYQKLARIEDDTDTGIFTESLAFQPEKTAKLIAAYCQRQQQQGTTYDLIVMGAQSADGANRKVPLLVAEHLGYACLTEVVGFSAIDENTVSIDFMQEDTLVRETHTLPLVLTVGNVSGAMLRIPTLMQRMAAKSIVPEVLEASELLTDFSPSVTPQKLTFVDQSRSSVMLEGETAEEKANAFYEAYLKPYLEEEQRRSHNG